MNRISNNADSNYMSYEDIWGTEEPRPSTQIESQASSVTTQINTAEKVNNIISIISTIVLSNISWLNRHVWSAFNGICRYVFGQINNENKRSLVKLSNESGLPLQIVMGPAPMSLQSIREMTPEEMEPHKENQYLYKKVGRCVNINNGNTGNYVTIKDVIFVTVKKPTGEFIWINRRVIVLHDKVTHLKVLSRHI